MRTSEPSNGIGVLSFSLPRYGTIIVAASCSVISFNGLRVHKGRDLKLSFQAGIFLEGMRRYYEMSGDEEALAYIKDSVDRLIDTGKIHKPRTCGACAIHISRY